MKIVIIGAGFSGLSAARKLKNLTGNNSIKLFDKNIYTTMIPSLPDFAGGHLRADMLTRSITELIPENIEFINEQITKINLEKKCVYSETGTCEYDYLIIASGSVTNFYGFSKHPDKLYWLDSLEQGIRIKNDFIRYVKNNSARNVIIAGAGYTGLELGFSLHHLARNTGKEINMTFVEMGDDILPFLNYNEREYIKTHLKRLNIKLITRTKVDDFDGQTVTLSNGQAVDNPFFIWTAGPKFAINEVTGNINTLKDGRIIIDEYCRIPGYPEVFAAGDSAAIQYKGTYLRRTVNFAIGSGKRAGKNLVRVISEKKPVPFKPLDLGWIIPLHCTSIGRIMDRIHIKGTLGLRLHYLMAGYRNYSLRNFFKYMKVFVKLFRR